MGYLITLKNIVIQTNQALFDASQFTNSTCECFWMLNTLLVPQVYCSERRTCRVPAAQRALQTKGGLRSAMDTIADLTNAASIAEVEKLVAQKQELAAAQAVHLRRQQAADLKEKLRWICLALGRLACVVPNGAWLPFGVALVVARLWWQTLSGV